MAFRSTGYLRQLAKCIGGGGKQQQQATYATSSLPKMKSYANPTADFSYGGQDMKQRKQGRGDFVAVYVAIGMITLSTALGLHTAMQQLKNSPQVRVNKKRRESLPEVEEPERVLTEADKFMKQSFFRKVAHVQENNADYTVTDPTRADIFVRQPKAETLESVGVNPKFRALDG